MRGFFSRLSYLVFLSVLSSSITAGTIDDHAVTTPVSTPTAQPVSAPQCELLPQYGRPRLLQGHLSPFWSQEYVGMPYIHDALARIAAQQGPLHTVNYGVMDGGFINDRLTGEISPRLRAILDHTNLDSGGAQHGTNAANLINGVAPSGYAFGRMHALTVDYTNPAASVAAMRHAGVDVVSCSIWWERDEPIPGLAELARQSIVVFSAGNSNGSATTPHWAGQPTPGSVAMTLGTALNPLGGLAATASTMPDIISVGSVSPRGWASNFSQPGAEVVISAPADWHQQVGDNHGYHEFGGTSGAAPLVAGASGLAKGVLGELTTPEMKELLIHTAVPTTFSAQGRNGAGMLNAYKIVEVAGRLRKLGWPNHRAELLRNPAVYDFSVSQPGDTGPNAAQLLADGQRLLTQPACSSQQRGFAMIHRAFLLTAGTPGDASARINSQAKQALIAALDQNGLTVNADFFRSLDPRQNEALIAQQLVAQNFVLGNKSQAIDPLVRPLENIPPDHAHALLAHAMASSNLHEVRNAVQVATQRTPIDVPLFRDALAHQSAAGRLQIVRGLTRLSAEVLPILETEVSDPDAQVRVAAVNAVSSKEYGTPAVNAFFTRVLAHSHDPDVIAVARNALGLPSLNPTPTETPAPPPVSTSGTPKES